MGHNKLTAKQNAFAEDVANEKYEFIWEAHEANYPNKMSQNTRYQAACRLRSNSKVIARIKEIKDKIKAAEKVTLDEIIVKLSQRVSLDIRDMFDDDNRMKTIKNMTQEQAMFINSWETHETFRGSEEEPIRVEIKKVKMESIKDMLDMLIRHYGGYIKDKVDPNSNTDELKALLKDLNIEI